MFGMIISKIFVTSHMRSAQSEPHINEPSLVNLEYQMETQENTFRKLTEIYDNLKENKVIFILVGTRL